MALKFVLSGTKLQEEEGGGVIPPWSGLNMILGSYWGNLTRKINDFST